MGEGARRGFTYPPDRYPRSGDDKAHTLCVPRVRFPFPASVSTIDFVSTRVSSIHCDTTHEDRVSHRVDRISKLGKSNMGKIVHVFSCAYRNITFTHSPLSLSLPPPSLRVFYIQIISRPFRHESVRRYMLRCHSARRSAGPSGRIVIFSWLVKIKSRLKRFIPLVMIY